MFNNRKTKFKKCKDCSFEYVGRCRSCPKCGCGKYVLIRKFKKKEKKN